MSAVGTTPTPATDPGGIAGDDYAEKVAIESTWTAKRLLRRLTVTGTNALTATTVAGDAPIAALVEGMRLSFVPPNTNTGAMTIAPDGIGAVNLLDQDGAALTTGQVRAGRPIEAEVYSDGDVRIVVGLAPSSSATKLAILANKRTNAVGGTLSSGSDQTIALNTKVYDDIGITGTLPDFVLPAGTYDIDASAVVEEVGGVQLRLYNVTDSADVTGTYGLSNRLPTSNVSTEISLKGRITLSAAKTLRLVARVSVTNATDGQGGVQSAGGYFTTADLYYSLIRISVPASTVAGPVGPSGGPPGPEGPQGEPGAPITFCKFFPADNEYQGSNYAVFGVRNAHPYLGFDRSAQKIAIFSDILPDSYEENGLVVRIRAAMATATSGTLGWDVAFERVNAAGLDIDGDSFATAKVATAATVPGTSGQVMVHTVTFADNEIDGLEPGELYRIRVRRNLSGDTATGAAQLLSVDVKGV